MTAIADLRLSVRLTTERLAARTLALLGDQVSRLDSERYIADPYPVYEKIRAAGPLYRSRTGYWATPSHPHCAAVLRDPRFGVEHAGTFDAAPSEAAGDAAAGPLARAFLSLDPPDHTRLRRLAAPAFRPKLIQAYRSRITAVAHRLLDGVADRDGFDLVTDFAAPLPITVISDLMGITGADTDRLARYGAVIGQALDGVRTVALAHRLRAATDNLTALFTDLMQQRRQHPGDDVVSLLTGAETDARLTAEELVATCQLLLIAGFETTVNLIGSATRLLLAHPDQWDLLRETPDLATNAVEETLRLEPPVQLTQRIANADADLAGHHLPAGSMVLVLIAAANRDPDVYPAPARFDITRPRDTEHLSFSSGIHYCLGAPLARAEGEIALRTLVERMPHLHSTGPVHLRRSLTLRGPLHLPVAA